MGRCPSLTESTVSVTIWPLLELVSLFRWTPSTWMTPDSPSWMRTPWFSPRWCLWCVCTCWWWSGLEREIYWIKSWYGLRFFYFYNINELFLWIKIILWAKKPTIECFNALGILCCLERHFFQDRNICLNNECFFLFS